MGMMGTNRNSPARVKAQAFKDVMARWATGVTITTTCQSGSPAGMTVSSFTRVSAQPPLILVCVNQHANTHAALVESGYFAVNFLSADQQEWGLRFAALQPALSDRFAGITWSTAQTGAPILPGVIGWLDCLLQDIFPGGDHTIFVGEVVACGCGNARAPLLHYSRDWWRLAKPQHAQET